MDYLEALADFPRAKDFSYTVHEALLDQPPVDEVDCASRSVNLFLLQSEVNLSKRHFSDTVAYLFSYHSKFADLIEEL